MKPLVVQVTFETKRDNGRKNAAKFQDGFLVIGVVSEAHAREVAKAAWIEVVGYKHIGTYSRVVAEGGYVHGSLIHAGEFAI